MQTLPATSQDGTTSTSVVRQYLPPLTSNAIARPSLCMEPFTKPTLGKKLP